MDFKATHICHWPGQDVPCCDVHKQVLRHVNAAMGLPALSFDPAPDGAQCTNCHNKARREANDPHRG